MPQSISMAPLSLIQGNDEMRLESLEILLSALIAIGVFAAVWELELIRQILASNQKR